MKQIELTQGQVALVDDEDYEWLNQWKWTAQRIRKTNIFLQITIEKKTRQWLMTKPLKNILANLPI